MFAVPTKVISMTSQAARQEAEQKDRTGFALTRMLNDRCAVKRLCY